VSDDIPQLSVSDPFMQAAYSQAAKSYREGGIPIGAVIVFRGEIIGAGHNSRVQRGNPLLHGEMAAYENAGRRAPAVYRECTLYTTHSPCSMCTGTTLLYKLPRVVIGDSRGAAEITNYLNSGKTVEGFLRSVGLEVVVYDDPAPFELLARFAREKPDVWAEDIGDDGDFVGPHIDRLT
jgi:cytosine deaminase